MVDVQALVNDLVIKLKKRKIEGSLATAKLTAELLHSVINERPKTDQAPALIHAVNVVGQQLIAANPGVVRELVVGNIVRRVLHIIRGENLSLITPSLQTLSEDVPTQASAHPTPSSGGDSEGSADKNCESSKLKNDAGKDVSELILEIEACHEQIANQAVELIHQNEVILTIGSSRTVLEFLCAAKELKRSLRVFVAEGAPRYEGHLLAKELVTRGVKTTLITDSAIFAIVSRVNMVIVGAHAVMANGGVMAAVGLNMVALAAKRHTVPFVVLAGSHKLCPLQRNDLEGALNEQRSPSEVLDSGEFSDCMDFGTNSGSPLLHVVNPTFDYVSPSLVTIFITNLGGHIPSDMHRLIADHYSADESVIR